MKKLLILVIVLVAAYFALDKFYPQILQKIPVVKQEVIKEAEQKLQDETANWKTYRNEEYGFEFKYPENWVLNLNENRWQLELKKNTRQERIFISVVATKARFEQNFLNTIEEWMAQRPNAKCGSVKIGNYDWCFVQDKFEAVRADNYGITKDDTDYIIQFNVGYGSQRMDYYIPDSELTDEINVFKQILSTFKFIK